MSYRSKRTLAQTAMKEDEVQKVKKQNTAPVLSSQIAPDGGDERWGPFCPPNKYGASHLGTNNLLNTASRACARTPAPTPAPDGSSTKSYKLKLQQIKNGQSLVTQISPPQKTHLTSPFQAQNLQLKPRTTTTTCSPSNNATEQVPARIKSDPIWRDSSSKPSVGKPLILEKKNPSDPSTKIVGAPTTQTPVSPRTNILKSTSPLPFATNGHTVKFKSNLINTSPRPSTQAASTLTLSPQTNILKSTSPLPFATNGPHTLKFKSNLINNSPRPSTQAASTLTTSPQTGNLKSTSSLAFATNRPHTFRSDKSDIQPDKSDIQSDIPDIDNIEISPKNQDTGMAPPDNDSGDKKPFKPRRHKVVIPEWPDEVAFDEKDEVITIDKEGNYKAVSDSIQPHDVWHADGTKYFVTFNEFYQPLKMGGHILVRFIGDVAKNEKFCPIGETDWRRVSAQLKVDIIKLIRDRFVIPDGELFDQAILKRTGKSTRLYRYQLKNLLFKPTTKTKEQIYGAVPSGHPRPSWIRLVDYWYSEKGKRLSESGKEARATQNHMHTTGPTSYANIRADFEEKNNREPSILEIFKQTHRKKDGTFVKDTLTEDFLIDVDANIYTKTVMEPSSSKSRVQIENEVFNSMMYGEEIPKRPIGYGYGVKQSDVDGVHGILRKEGFGCGENNSLALENMKKVVANVTKENKVLVKSHEELKTKYDESNVLLKKMTTQFSQILDVFSTGKATTEFIDIAKSVLNMNMASTKVPDSSDGDDKPTYGDD